jgi:hypothetical protein
LVGGEHVGQRDGDIGMLCPKLVGEDGAMRPRRICLRG